MRKRLCVLICCTALLLRPSPAAAAFPALSAILANFSTMLIDKISDWLTDRTVEVIDDYFIKFSFIITISAF